MFFIFICKCLRCRKNDKIFLSTEIKESVVSTIEIHTEESKKSIIKEKESMTNTNGVCQIKGGEANTKRVISNITERVVSKPEENLVILGNYKFHVDDEDKYFETSRLLDLENVQRTSC